MEERTGWGSAIGAAWGNLTGVNTEGRVVRLLFFLIFLLGTVWAVYSYMESTTLMELEPMTAMVLPVTPADTDRARLGAMIQQVETTSRMRTTSVETVRPLEIVGRLPFDEPPVPTGVIVLGEEEPPFILPDPVVIIEYPPHITLRGIMVMGNQQVAVIDISGVGTGMIVRAGDTFMQRRGRVVRIASDRIVVNYAGRNWDIAPSF